MKHSPHPAKISPVDYSSLDWQQRRAIREQYIEQQNGECFYCGSPLAGEPLKDLQDIPIDWSLFPENFLRYPVHLQHNHTTGFTEGSVHSLCNALMWNYFRK